MYFLYLNINKWMEIDEVNIPTTKIQSDKAFRLFVFTYQSVEQVEPLILSSLNLLHCPGEKRCKDHQ